MIFLDRRRSGPDPLLEWKGWILAAGAILALAGIRMGSSFLTGAAIVVLLGGVGLRFLRPRGSGEGEAEEEGAEDDASRGRDDRPT